jgi:hypothetical protein
VRCHHQNVAVVHMKSVEGIAIAQHLAPDCDRTRERWLPLSGQRHSGHTEPAGAGFNGSYCAQVGCNGEAG